MKTVRFSQIVEASGKPELHTLWTDPKDDAVFQRALKQHRVMTVRQQTVGNKADYGTVGFDKSKVGELLIFSKSLKQFDGKKVVGVKYDFLEKPAKAAQDEVKTKERKPVKARKKKPQPRDEKIVAFTLTQEAKPTKERHPAAASKTLRQIRSDVRRAIKALEGGKAVKAHQMLQELERELAVR